jgi:hypothetical protein
MLWMLKFDGARVRVGTLPELMIAIAAFPPGGNHRYTMTALGHARKN